VRPRGTMSSKHVAEARRSTLEPIVIAELNVGRSRCGPLQEAIKALTGKERVDVTFADSIAADRSRGSRRGTGAKPVVLTVILTMY